MQTGIGTSATLPVGTKSPESLSILKVTIVSLSWFAASKKFPVGSIAKFRGVAPWVRVWPIGVRRPVVLDTANLAMLLCPRFEPYTKRPSGETCMSAQVVSSVKPSGKVDTVCMVSRIPRSLS